jgi:AcrR family transcriptional regulator
MLLRRGYAGLRYQDVSDESGVAVASLRHYFPTLAELRKEALRHLVRSELDELEGLLAETDDPWERLRRFCVGALSLDSTGGRDGWLLWLEYWRAAAHDAELAKDRIAVDDAWDAYVLRCIEEGVARGRFHLDQTPSEAARELHALIDGFGGRLTVESSMKASRAAEAALERAVRRLLGFAD